MPLYKISEKYFSFLQACENDEIPDETLHSTLESLDDEFDKKADSVACFIKNFECRSQSNQK
jgi:hypothetical protein